MTPSIQKTLELFRERFKNLNDSTSEGGYDALPYVEAFLSQALTEQHEADVQSFREMLIAKKEKEKFDNMYCSKCGNFIRERFSHNSEDGFSECCGKKLERKQGEAFTDSHDNISPLTSVLLSTS